MPEDTTQTSASVTAVPTQALKPSGPLTMAKLLQLVVDRDASDLHLTAGYPPILRIDGKLVSYGVKPLEAEDVKKLVLQTLPDEQKELLEVNKEVDLSYAFEEKARFRINAYNERGNVAAAYRLIPQEIRSMETLGLPQIFHEFTKLPQGLVLLTGPTGHGKSTTLAALLNEINMTQARHIVTIEDPIEYLYPVGKSLVDQRELHRDTHSWEIALRSVLRQDPDVVLLGEMRDYETISAAITVAETGHLVFATLHTNSASQSIDRIIDVFPEHQQAQTRTQLANILEGVVSQRLVPVIGGGRKAVVEVMLATSAVRNTIREGKTYQIDNIIATSGDVGMISLEKSLVNLVREGKLTLEEAQAHSLKPEEIVRLVRG